MDHLQLLFHEVMLRHCQHVHRNEARAGDIHCFLSGIAQPGRHTAGNTVKVSFMPNLAQDAPEQTKLENIDFNKLRLVEFSSRQPQMENRYSNAS
ncbi:hypothetical protein [Oricola cellulosilytica]|uniref:Uncharacterized protein n=1 Tax=Oricola cellulosilytica TaxID=1429082 RepID=A0A4R0PBB6_9HYPH|nr:hypothetical protein [Oricola cellulosilytica]TCD13321.1 hypothetical protein E0D97_12560 [Oricola cellulosilytica]